MMMARGKLARFFALAFASLMMSFGAIADPPPQPLQWSLSREIYVIQNQSRLYSDNVVWGQCGGPAPAGECGQNVWHRVDLKPYGILPTANAAFLSGMLLISHGGTLENTDIHITFKRPGDIGDCSKPMGQTQSAQHESGGPIDVIGVAEDYYVPNGSSRANASTWVALENGEFDWCMIEAPGGAAYPVSSGWGVNFSVQAWVQ